MAHKTIALTTELKELDGLESAIIDKLDQVIQKTRPLKGEAANAYPNPATFDAQGEQFLDGNLEAGPPWPPHLEPDPIQSAPEFFPSKLAPHGRPIWSLTQSKASQNSSQAVSTFLGGAPWANLEMIPWLLLKQAVEHREVG